MSQPLYRVFVEYRDRIRSYYLNGDEIDSELTSLKKTTDFVRVIQIIKEGELPV